MGAIRFTKMVASGNDFIVIRPPFDKRYPLKVLAKKLCNRKYGVGADGVLHLGASRVADIKMRIFNADGSEAQMCGNGARCTALFVSVKGQMKPTIETKAGVITSEVKGDLVKIRLTDPEGMRLDVPLMLGRRSLKVNFVNIGVPHTVIFVEGLRRIDVVPIGRAIRNHRSFAPFGTNVNFVEPVNRTTIEIRTYERGVEDETLACGTGSVASALIFASKINTLNAVNVRTRGGEILRVHFNRRNGAFSNVWLQGRAKKVFQGDFVY